MPKCSLSSKYMQKLREKSKCLIVMKLILKIVKRKRREEKRDRRKDNVVFPNKTAPLSAQSSSGTDATNMSLDEFCGIEDDHDDGQDGRDDVAGVLNALGQRTKSNMASELQECEGGGVGFQAQECESETNDQEQFVEEQEPERFLHRMLFKKPPYEELPQNVFDVDFLRHGELLAQRDEATPIPATTERQQIVERGEWEGDGIARLSAQSAAISANARSTLLDEFCWTEDVRDGRDAMADLLLEESTDHLASEPQQECDDGDFQLVEEQEEPEGLLMLFKPQREPPKSARQNADAVFGWQGELARRDEATPSPSPSIATTVPQFIEKGAWEGGEPPTFICWRRNRAAAEFEQQQQTDVVFAPTIDSFRFAETPTERMDNEFGALYFLFLSFKI